MAGMGALREKSHELPTMRRRLVPRKASARSRVSNGVDILPDVGISRRAEPERLVRGSRNAVPLVESLIIRRPAVMAAKKA